MRKPDTPSAPLTRRHSASIPLCPRLRWQGGLAVLVCAVLALAGAHAVQGGEGRGGRLSTTPVASVSAMETPMPGGGGEADSMLTRIESLFVHGGLVMWVLLATSVFGATFAMERCFALRRGAHIPAGLTETLREKLLQGGTLPAVSWLESRREGLARVLHGVLSRPGATRQEMERVLEDELSRALWDERRYIRPVGIVAQVAPLLGLLGTVIGLIGAFQQAADHGMDDPTLFAGGIYQALYTTAFGLTISIPFLIAYQYLRSKADSILREIEVVSQRFVFAISRDMSLAALQQSSVPAFSQRAPSAPGLQAYSTGEPRTEPAPPSASTSTGISAPALAVACAPPVSGAESLGAASSSAASSSAASSSAASSGAASSSAAPGTGENPVMRANPSMGENASAASSPETAPAHATPATPPSRGYSPDDPASALLEGDADSDELLPEMR